MAAIIQISTTLDSREAALALGRSLVDSRLAACCQVTGPVKSIYRWKGKVEESDEWYCIIKTQASLYRETEEAIKKAHPYEVPEIVAIHVHDALTAYAVWVEEETTQGGR